MQRLLYISTARQPLDQRSLDALLRTSRRNNAAVGVTGLLVVGGRRFLQAIEGEEAAVAGVFNRIAADPRHFAVVSLAREEISARAFGEWSMGHVSGGRVDATAGPTAAVAQLIAPIADPTLRAYFTGFTQTQAAA